MDPSISVLSLSVLPLSEIREKLKYPDCSHPLPMRHGAGLSILTSSLLRILSPSTASARSVITKGPSSILPLPSTTTALSHFTFVTFFHRKLTSSPPLVIKLRYFPFLPITVPVSLSPLLRNISSAKAPVRATKISDKRSIEKTRRRNTFMASFAPYL